MPPSKNNVGEAADVEHIDKTELLQIAAVDDLTDVVEIESTEFIYSCIVVGFLLRKDLEEELSGNLDERLANANLKARDIYTFVAREDKRTTSIIGTIFSVIASVAIILIGIILRDKISQISLDTAMIVFGLGLFAFGLFCGLYGGKIINLVKNRVGVLSYRISNYLLGPNKKRSEGDQRD